MSVALAEISRGFHDPIHGAQRTFRALLDAMARPGNERELQLADLDGLEPPASATPGRPLGAGLTAALLTLLDAEATVRLAGSLASAAALAYLRFHTGARPASLEESAAFTVARGADVDEGLCSRLDLGTDEAPQRGATLLVEVDELGSRSGGARLVLQGPGIPEHSVLTVSGLSRDFWRWRIDLQPQLPRGIDLVLVCGARIAAIPRSTRITLAG